MWLKGIATIFALTIPSTAGAILIDLGSFVAQTGTNSVATFDDVANGTTSPFSSSGVLFSTSIGGASVTNSLVGLPHSFWFGSAGSAPDFFGPILGFSASLPSPVEGVGFLYSGFGSGLDNVTYTLYSGPGQSGLVVGSGSAVFDLNTIINGSGSPNFFGVTSSTPFQSVVIGAATGGTYVIDDFRFASTATASATSEPSTAALVVLAMAGFLARSSLFRLYRNSLLL